MTIEPFVRRATELVVRCTDPDEVWLFGSQAKGTATLESDVDLIVIGAFTGPPARRAPELRGLLAGRAVHVDLHLVTRAEIAAAPPHTWLRTIWQSARRVYHRPENGKDDPIL